MIKFQTNTFNLKELEGLAAKEAIEYTRGNVKFACELLNVSKMTMYRIFKEHNIDIDSVRKKYEWRHLGWKTKKAE